MPTIDINVGSASGGGFRNIFWGEAPSNANDGINTYLWDWETPATVYDSTINKPAIYNLVYKTAGKKIKLLRSTTNPAVYQTISTGGLGFIIGIYQKRVRRQMPDMYDIALVNDSTDLDNHYEQYSFSCCFPCYEYKIKAEHLQLVNAAALPNVKASLNLTTHAALVDGMIVVDEYDGTHPIIRFKQGVYA